jgi:uncharacterized membrane protein YdjX (TVP38/TMEM64 family)|tara:strand:- start:256 stop:930 length:675 start_codon:yes stop_codon:yes gene_type:complete
VIAFFLSLVFIFPDLQKFASPEFIRFFVLSFGFFAFVAYVLLVTLAVPFNIPSTPVILAGGYIFGTVGGFLLSLLGMIIGSTLAFYITRLGGKPLLKRGVDPHHIKHFDTIFKKRGPTAALISYALPIFPTDAVSLFLGLTNMKYKLFFFLVLLGHIPRLLIIILLGSDLYTGFSMRTLIVLVAAIIFVLITIFREKIMRIFFAELRIFQKEVGIIESWIGLKK